jgi:hypothetical protein
VRVWACEYDMNQMNEREYQMNLFSVTLMLMSEAEETNLFSVTSNVRE